MSRKSARDWVFKLVFELCFMKPEESGTYEAFLENNDLSGENLTFVKDMYEGVVAQFEPLTQLISAHIKGYTLDRLYKVDLAILMVSFYEIGFYKQTPVNIVANEAVELAKKYSTEKSYGFINAVISDYIKSLKG